jgi:DNA-binding response OmpR family regulator
MKVLVIEDNKVIASFIRNGLKQHGFVVDLAGDGREGLEAIKINKDSYDIIILDIMLPSIDGLTLCKTLRDEKIFTPILMLSGKNSTEDKINGLEAGADDYLAKPFDISELIARIKAITRRKTESFEDVISIANLKINSETHQVFYAEKEIELTPTEFRLLHLLMQNKNKVISRSVILEKVWDSHGDDLYSNTIDVHIRSLRKKIDSFIGSPLIVTVRGAGYKLLSN